MGIAHSQPARVGCGVVDGTPGIPSSGVVHISAARSSMRMGIREKVLDVVSSAMQEVSSPPGMATSFGLSLPSTSTTRSSTGVQFTEPSPVLLFFRCFSFVNACRSCHFFRRSSHSRLTHPYLPSSLAISSHCLFLSWLVSLDDNGPKRTFLLSLISDSRKRTSSTPKFGFLDFTRFSSMLTILPTGPFHFWKCLLYRSYGGQWVKTYCFIIVI